MLDAEGYNRPLRYPARAFAWQYSVQLLPGMTTKGLGEDDRCAALGATDRRSAPCVPTSSCASIAYGSGGGIRCKSRMWFAGLCDVLGNLGMTAELGGLYAIAHFVCADSAIKWPLVIVGFAYGAATLSAMAVRWRI